MLKRMELECIKKPTHLKLKSKLHNKINVCKDNYCTYRAKHKLASLDA